MPYATNPEDGVRIYYEVEGDGTPLVLLAVLDAEQIEKTYFWGGVLKQPLDRISDRGFLS